MADHRARALGPELCQSRTSVWLSDPIMGNDYVELAPKRCNASLVQTRGRQPRSLHQFLLWLSIPNCPSNRSSTTLAVDVNAESIDPLLVSGVMLWQLPALHRLHSSHSSQSNILKHFVADTEALCIMNLPQPASWSASCSFLVSVNSGLQSTGSASSQSMQPIDGPSAISCRQKKHLLVHYVRQAKDPAQIPRLKDQKIHQSHCDARTAFLEADSYDAGRRVLSFIWL